jgi:tRNA1(Val) A37 N6-methylase TrmN6
MQKATLRKIRDFLLPMKEDIPSIINSIASLIAPDREFPFLVNSKTKKKISALVNWQSESVNILGVIYESLLSSPPGSCKQTHRHTSGIFYTPDHIASFLVKSALDSASFSPPPSILDPACGSGAFLIAAFRELRHRGYDHETIISQCLHGVDTDPDAVHVAQLSLYLESSLPKSSWPIFEKSIIHGNSLEVWADPNSAKYDVVVGNPPYRNVKRGIPPSLASFCKAYYKTARGQWDLAAPFVEAALTNMLHPDGVLAFILPNPLLLAENYQPLREIILENYLVAYGPVGKTFDDPNVEASLLVVKKSRPGKNSIILDGRSGLIEKKSKIDPSLLNSLPFKTISHTADPSFLKLILEKLFSGDLVEFGSLVKLTRGIECGKNDPRVVDLGTPGSRPLLTGDSVEPFLACPRYGFMVDSCTDLKDPSLWDGETQLVIRRVAPYPIAAVMTPPALALNTLYIAQGDFDPHVLCALINSEYFRKLFLQIYAFDDKLFPYLRISQLSRMPIPNPGQTT